MDKYNGTVQYFIFELTFYYIFLVLLQPLPPPNSMLLGGNEVKIVCRAESGPVYAPKRRVPPLIRGEVGGI